MSTGSACDGENSLDIRRAGFSFGKGNVAPCDASIDTEATIPIGSDGNFSWINETGYATGTFEAADSASGDVAELELNDVCVGDPWEAAPADGK